MIIIGERFDLCIDYDQGGGGVAVLRVPELPPFLLVSAKNIAYRKRTVFTTLPLENPTLQSRLNTRM